MPDRARAQFRLRGPRNAFLALTLAFTVGGAVYVQSTASGARTAAPSVCHSSAGLPDASCTPGVIDPAVTQATIQSTICLAGYTARVRPPTSTTDLIKTARMAAYGYGGQPVADYELDHLIPLELGGAPRDVGNLWPEPWNGDHNAHDKDAIENRLHAQVCSGQLPLADAQQAIARNWEQAVP